LEEIRQKMANVEVSIITAAYNAEKYIADTIESVQKQTFSNWEYIIADNGSTDRTVEVVKRFLSDLRIKFISEPRKGKSFARNAAFVNSQGKYIANIDADDLWRPDKLEKQVALLRADFSVGLVYTGAILIDAQGKTRSVCTPADISRKPLHYLLTVGNPIIHSSVMIRREVFSDGKYQDETIERVDEQIVYLKTCLMFGKMGFISEPLTSYRVHIESEHSKGSVRGFCAGYEKGLTKFFQRSSLPKEIEQLKRPAYGTMFYLSASVGIQQKKELGLCALYLLKSAWLRPSKIHYCMAQFGKLILSAFGQSQEERT